MRSEGPQVLTAQGTLAQSDQVLRGLPQTLRGPQNAQKTRMRLGAPSGDQKALSDANTLYCVEGLLRRSEDPFNCSEGPSCDPGI